MRVGLGLVSVVLFGLSRMRTIVIARVISLTNPQYPTTVPYGLQGMYRYSTIPS